MLTTTFISLQSAATILSIIGSAQAALYCDILGCPAKTTTITAPAVTVHAAAVTVTYTASPTTVTLTKPVTVTVAGNGVTLSATRTITSLSTVSVTGASCSLPTSVSSAFSSSATSSSTTSTSISVSSSVLSGSSVVSSTGTAKSSSTSTSASATSSASGGVVTLPYATYKAAVHNTTSNFYKYSNIRFAAAPTGSLRFKNPVAPTTVETTVQDGSYGQTCYQLEQGSNSQAANQGEDCLFLDVVVPDNIPAGTKLPVLFYIYGGGWHTGQKELYDGTDLVAKSNGSIIYVVPNYRLGAFGFLGQFGDTQPAMMDQLLAMEWVQSYISLFGGDKDRVTVAGHSAGAGCLENHLISNGGAGTLPFSQAVVMSSAVAPLTPDRIATRNNAMLSYFSLLDATEATILALDASAINDFTGHIGASGWGPIIDGTYIQELPANAFTAGRYHKGLPLITGKVADEAHDFIPSISPYVIDGSADVRDATLDTKAQMATFFTTFGFQLSNSTINSAWDLYPMINNTDIYYTMFGKYDLVASEVLLTCNTYYMAKAYDTVYAWDFTVYPAYHAQENPYLFVGGTGNGGTSSLPIDRTLAEHMKSYLVNFVQGDINADSNNPVWDAWSVAGQNIELSSTNLGMIADISNNDRCVFWETNTN